MGTAYKEFGLYLKRNKKSLMGSKLGKGTNRCQFRKAYSGSCVEEWILERPNGRRDTNMEIGQESR